MSRANRTDHIRLTSHPEPGRAAAFPIHWGAADARARGPIIGTVSRAGDRNVIGSHGGSYAMYRALAVSAGALDPIRRPDLTNTFPAATIGPFEQWRDPAKIVALDPWGHLVAENFGKEIAEGSDIRPSIAVTRARLDLPEIREALAAKRLRADGEVVHANGSVSVVKIAIDPVWYLPGLAERFATNETELRRTLFEQTAGMFPELVTRPDMKVFLPPIGGTTVYMFGDVTKLPDHRTKITCRVHDECNGSDVFGSDICTCRPYLIHGIEESARGAQEGGLGLVPRPDMKVFLPPIGGTTVYMFGDVTKLPDHRTKITCRVHDECNGSDVFGSDICTCRPYLIHGIEESARGAQEGGLGLVIYNRKEGRALGEVTKFLVYNARKRQEDGDAAAAYFERTECVAGVQDARFQQLMPDTIHWLGLKRIDRFLSMSDMKHDALTSQGIEIVERVPIPLELIPADAHVEIAAKKAAGYYSTDIAPEKDVNGVVGRSLEKY